MSKRRLLVSIHDVMPDTLEDTDRILARLEAADIRTVTLLIVPGTGWDAESLQRLRIFAQRGALLAGHGWKHRVTEVRGFRHRLHSLFISRDVAEHLALSREGAGRLMHNCYRWFRENQLPEPELYVPPAWAMGRVAYADLDSLPFRQYETLTGIYDKSAKRFVRTPMVGFEADTATRAFFCRLWNRMNLIVAGTSNPLRVAIHPRDLDLRLGGDLRNFISEGGTALAYDAINHTS